jgi:PPK2 family polyphosphate:nucleotide phosphotransferase
MKVKLCIMKDLITDLKDIDKDSAKNKTKEMVKEIGYLQYQMYAQKKHSILIVLQGLDASGKDGLVKDLLEYCNPVGLSVYSFKKPTPDEYARDFLWRVHKQAPAKGILQVFIRSHYEDILVPAVEGFFPPDYVNERYDMINRFEKLLQHNGTQILKFYMSVSREKQEERLNERITDPEKHWKHNDGDWETLKKRDLYLEVYQKIFEKCNFVPWEVIPSDKNWQKTYVASTLLLRTLRDMRLEWPMLESKLFVTR